MTAVGIGCAGGSRPSETLSEREKRVDNLRKPKSGAAGQLSNVPARVDAARGLRGPGEGCRMSPSFVAVSVMAACIAANVAAAQVRSTDEEGLAQFARLSPQTESIVLDAARLNQPVFIFLPGILGSKLTKRNPITGDWDVIFGRTELRDLKVDSKVLAYNPDDEIKAKLLDTYEFMKQNVDVYGKFFNLVSSIDIGDLPNFLYFPYDWRQDNRISAAQFDKQLLSENDTQLLSENWKRTLNGRRVILVSHSMGGLVATYWYYNHYSKNPELYPFDLDRIIFLGTPHSGTPAALWTLIRGYEEYPMFMWLFSREAAAEKVIAWLLNEVGHTFPSVYQLLPAYDVGHKYNGLPGYNVRRGHGAPRINIELRRDLNFHGHADVFSLNTWKEFDMLSRVRRETAPDDFYKRIGVYLADAKAFHEELDRLSKEHGRIPTAEYFYSTTHETLVEVRGKLDDGAKTRAIIRENTGDGRVPMETALNLYRDPNPNAHEVDRKHDDLVNDRKFLNHVGLIISLAQTRRNWQIVTSVPDNRLIDVLATAGAILDQHLDPASRSEPEVQAIVKLNERVLARIAEASNVELPPGCFAHQIARRSPEPVRMQLYAMAVALADCPYSVAWSANNLCHILFEQGEYALAEKYAVEAANVALANREEIAGLQELLSKSYNTAGAASMQRGDYGKASIFLKAGAYFGSKKAADNLRTLESITAIE